MAIGSPQSVAHRVSKLRNSSKDLTNVAVRVANMHERGTGYRCLVLEGDVAKGKNTNELLVIIDDR